MNYSHLSWMALPGPTNLNLHVNIINLLTPIYKLKEHYVYKGNRCKYFVMKLCIIWIINYQSILKTIMSLFGSFKRDEVAEWLRRWTANPLCSARVGSNPILVDVSYHPFWCFICFLSSIVLSILQGFARPEKKITF